MRTTITVEDRLLAQLRRRASESGTSVSRLIEQAVRLFIRTPRPSRLQESFELVTFGAGGRFSGQNIDKTAALLEADDVEHFGSRR
jgi:hypothetical protein